MKYRQIPMCFLPRISWWVLSSSPQCKGKFGSHIFLLELQVFKGLLTLNYLCLPQVQIISAILQNKFILPTFPVSVDLFCIKIKIPLVS